MSKDVLIVGGGGREHALAWKLAQSPRIGRLYIAPGNGGTGQIGENVPIPATNIDELARFAKEKNISLTVVGPDDPLALGIVDAFRREGLRIFGPTKTAAQIESSKAFAKELMNEAGVPTADFRVFTDHGEALSYLRAHGVPIVIKASGLALGKGVYVCKTFREAESALDELMLSKAHKAAGETVVIEDFLDGQEVSVHALSDGKDFILFPPAQDHKTIGEGDTGKNTGGMGTVAPVPWADKEMMRVVRESVVEPTLQTLSEKGVVFQGCLYPGLKMTSAGPKVLEFNARFGDPETQSYMRLLKTDLLDVLEACVDGKLVGQKLEWNPGFAACVVMASGGYPDEYKKGLPIEGLEEAEKVPGVVIFHAGTKLENGRLLTAGGRVLGVSAIGATLKEALTRAYEAAGKISFEGMQYRKDIGVKALAQS